ncbi:MAG: ABC transporter permease [Anaerolineales bacterium]|nr:ABC transporter permease [Anaerolineales bacterium]
MSEASIPLLDKSQREAEDKKIKYYTATQFQLMWWRFRRHKLAIFGSAILFLFFLIVIFAEFFAVVGGQTRDDTYPLGPPQLPHFIDTSGNFHLSPFVYGVKTERDSVTLALKLVTDESMTYPVRFFIKGEPYKLFGLIPGNIHFIGIEDGIFHPFGTDDLGRDIFSRTMFATRISLSIGVLGVMLSFFLGLFIGGISGYFGGRIDFLIQRLTEFIRSIPTLPLWMAISAALPKEWSALQIYFAITVILSLIGWTHLARRVRGKLLSVRNEDFVIAARLAGSSDARIISRHLLPSFLSYIIVDLSVSFPYMILGETSLSFIGLGLRPPIVSWGTLLQASQNIRTIAMHPWMFIPALFVIAAVLAFSFVGDGARDAADPYAR